MTELSTLREAIREAWDNALDSGKVVISDLADAVIQDNADLVDDLSRSLARSQVMKLIRELARAESENEGGQLSLLGFPVVLAVPAADDYIYMRATQANWQNLIDARTVRAENVARAQRKLDIYDEALDKVRPILEGTQLTLSDAIMAFGDAT